MLKRVFEQINLIISNECYKELSLVQGYLCPFGLSQEILYRAGSQIQDLVKSEITL